MTLIVTELETSLMPQNASTLQASDTNALGSVSSARVYRRVSDHQPSMLAWLPYYAKVLESDLHIVMTHVPYSTEHKEFNRFMASGNKIVVPANRAPSGTPINAIRSSKVGAYLLNKGLKQAYGRKTTYRERLDPIYEILGPQDHPIPFAEFNIRVLEYLLDSLKWKGTLVGDDFPVGTSKVKRSVDRLTKAGAELNSDWLYLCGKGTESYLKGMKFPYPTSVQSIANLEDVPSILDIMVKYKDPRDYILDWCEKNISWSEPRFL